MKVSDYCGLEEEKQNNFIDLPAPNIIVNDAAYIRMKQKQEDSVENSILEVEEEMQESAASESAQDNEGKEASESDGMMMNENDKVLKSRRSSQSLQAKKKA